MTGIWFAAMIACVIAAGITAQLGWQLPQMHAVRRVLRRRRTAANETPEGLAAGHPSAPA